MTDRLPLAELRDKVVIPACAVLSLLSGRDLASRDAVRFLLCATLQEDPKQQRRQQKRDGSGPLPGYEGAFGLCQIELRTVRRLQKHDVMRRIPAFGVLLASAQAEALCDEMAKPGGDILSFMLGRGLLLCDPYKIPSEQQAAYVCYDQRVWRPGYKRPQAWAANWKTATDLTEHLA